MSLIKIGHRRPIQPLFEKGISMMKTLFTAAGMSLLLQVCLVSLPAQAAGGQDPASAERALRTVLEEARSGNLDLSRFEDDIVPDVRANAGAVSGEIRRRGKVTAVQYLGRQATEAGDLHKFRVTFEKGQMLWSLILNTRGQIANIDMQSH
ncbi:hypothetical protein HQN82_10215 [Agrobacterium pusense]|nr:hypothetical protein HQN82_10215 [Agrobacterium pusense]